MKKLTRTHFVRLGALELQPLFHRAKLEQLIQIWGDQCLAKCCTASTEVGYWGIGRNCSLISMTQGCQLCSGISVPDCVAWSTQERNGPSPWGRGRREPLACLQLSRAARLSRPLLLPYVPFSCSVQSRKKRKVFVKALFYRHAFSPAPDTHPYFSAPWFGLSIAPSAVPESSAKRESEWAAVAGTAEWWLCSCSPRTAARGSDAAGFAIPLESGYGYLPVGNVTR